MYTPGGIKDICAGEISKVDRTVYLEPYVPVENQDGGGEGVSTNLPSLVDRLIGMVQDVYTAQGGVAGAYNPQYSPGCVLCVCRNCNSAAMEPVTSSKHLLQILNVNGAKHCVASFALLGVKVGTEDAPSSPSKRKRGSRSAEDRGGKLPSNAEHEMDGLHVSSRAARKSLVENVSIFRDFWEALSGLWPEFYSSGEGLQMRDRLRVWNNQRRNKQANLGHQMVEEHAKYVQTLTARIVTFEARLPAPSDADRDEMFLEVCFV